MDLAEIWAATQKTMLADLEKTRAALSHSGNKGTANENAVSELLRAHLPPSIGITSGEVVDATGGTSRQLDVILYDAARTPILYTGNSSLIQVVPIEGVIGVVEVKTHVRVSDVPGIVENMRSVKTLKHEAYIPQVNPTVTTMHGRSTNFFPPVYSLFAFEADNFDSFSLALGDSIYALPVHERVDLACVLGSGVSLNVELKEDRYLPYPTPSSVLGRYNTKNSLLLWYLLLSQVLLQAQQPPIDLTRYMPRDFAF